MADALEAYLLMSGDLECDGTGGLFFQQICGLPLRWKQEWL